VNIRFQEDEDLYSIFVEKYLIMRRNDMPQLE
jgi:hypothetical protein